MRNLVACFIALLVLAPLQAKRLPIKTYTTADGLARDHILCIYQDSHGFLWFCTAEGLSRFDGYRFTNYDTEQGLPSNQVEDFLETRRGVYWVATTGGLVRFDPKREGLSRFHRYPLGDREVPRVLYEDAAGKIWCGTSRGLVRLPDWTPDSAPSSSFERIDLPPIDEGLTSLLTDRDGTLWIGSSNGLIRRKPNGDIEPFSASMNQFIMALVEDRDGRLWVGSRTGLMRIDPAKPSHPGLQTRVYTERDGLPGSRIESLLVSSEGVLWVGTDRGLAEWIPNLHPGAPEFQQYTLAQGLTARAVGALAEDRDGNLWIGTFGSGAMKVAPRGFSTYTEADEVSWVGSLLESRQGEMTLVYRLTNELRLARFDGRHFTQIRPKMPSRVKYYGWGRGQIAFQDRAGEWWIATGQGLCRFSSVGSVSQLSGASPKAVYTMRDGLPGNNIFRIFEDSRGDVWVGTIGLGTQDGLTRWDRSTGSFHALSAVDGLPPKPLPTAFAEDRSGDIWVSLYHDGQLARYRGGRFQIFTAKDGLQGFIHTLFVDSAGRLWIGTTHGLLCVDNPGQQQFHFVRYGSRNGFSSDETVAITEDLMGRIYAATGRGIDRFEAQASGPARIKHYTSADGIAPGELDLAFRDRKGTLWFTTPLGISQLIPTADGSRAPPPVLITGLSVGGVARPVSDLGETSLSGFRLPPSPLRLDYVGLGFSPGEALRYQYMLEGAEQTWSEPTDQRSVVYARLSPGNYRFLVRAIGSDGTASRQPASVAFTIPPPLWRSWWFMVAGAIGAVLIVYALHRYRLRQMLAVAHVRTRIATDLHDDIGASLSQIAILSEVAQRHGNGSGPRNSGTLSEIAAISRGLVDSMSDIVWAINPEHDRLSNLVSRMRRFATDLLGSQGIELHFRSTVADNDLKIGPDVRRQVYLIFKEAIHNIVRHSWASRVEVDMDRVDDNLVLNVRDNGKGFTPSRPNDGQGLISMRRRAAALGGYVDLQSAPGSGSTVRMIMHSEAGKTLSVLRGKSAGVFR